jgi:hypothetical protein
MYLHLHRAEICRKWVVVVVVITGRVILDMVTGQVGVEETHAGEAAAVETGAEEDGVGMVEEVDIDHIRPRVVEHALGK